MCIQGCVGRERERRRCCSSSSNTSAEEERFLLSQQRVGNICGVHGRCAGRERERERTSERARETIAAAAAGGGVGCAFAHPNGATRKASVLGCCFVWGTVHCAFWGGRGGGRRKRGGAAARRAKKTQRSLRTIPQLKNSWQQGGTERGRGVCSPCQFFGGKRKLLFFLRRRHQSGACWKKWCAFSSFGDVDAQRGHTHALCT